ncbi:hypothetical protein ACHMW5_13375 [Azospirillum melinis]|uniref:hypothetical protein n=1 Tax=Azospirillum melinis TaxID=328839 RepID=UPI00375771BC
MPQPDLLHRARSAVMVGRAITDALKAAQKPITASLWGNGPGITFVPQVLPHIFGDGRALFYFGTINSRPAYWLVRGDSRWTCDMDYGPEAPDGCKDFRDNIDEVLSSLEDEFGRAENGHDFIYGADGKPHDPETGKFLPWRTITYPVVNYGGGSYWGREDWPDLPGVEFAPHPFHPDVRIIATLEASHG